MQTRRILLGLGAASVAAALAFVPTAPRGPSHAQAAVLPEARGPRVALVATRPGAELSSLYLVRAGEPGDPAPVATFGHLADAVVRAAVLPGSDVVLATADTTPGRDASFNASLFRLTPHAPPVTLVDRVVHASRPLVTRAARIFISRGAAGPEVDGQMRIDALSIEEVNGSTGQTRVVHAADGYLLFLVGAAGREIVLYRVLPKGADLVAVDPDSGALRPILKSMPPFARDFSIDAAGQRVVFQNRHESDAQTWVIEEVDLASGHKNRLFSSPSMALAPALLPKGSLLYNPPGRGLSTLDAEMRVSSPLGAGVDVVAASTADERWIAALHTQPSALSVPFVLETTSGAAAVLPAPSGVRVEIAGITTENGGAR